MFALSHIPGVPRCLVGLGQPTHQRSICVTGYTQLGAVSSQKRGYLESALVSLPLPLLSLSLCLSSHCLVRGLVPHTVILEDLITQILRVEPGEPQES